MEKTLIVPESLDDIPGEYRATPIETLIGIQNGLLEPANFPRAELLLVTCMDNRIALKLPHSFAFVLRTAGGRISKQDFPVAFTIAIGGVKAMAILGHDDCGMLNLPQKRKSFIHGMKMKTGWDEGQAGVLFNKGLENHAIDEVISFTRRQVEKLRSVYPGIPAAPLLYRIHTGKICIINEDFTA